MSRGLRIALKVAGVALIAGLFYGMGWLDRASDQGHFERLAGDADAIFLAARSFQAREGRAPTQSELERLTGPWPAGITYVLDERRGEAVIHVIDWESGVPASRALSDDAWSRAPRDPLEQRR